MSDIAATALANRAGPSRTWLENWLRSNAPSRAEKLRIAAERAPVDLRELSRPPTDALAAVARDANASASYADDATKLANLLNALDARCPAAREPAGYGRLAPEAIQQTVRANFGSMRRCYEDGLAANPQLGGRVVTKFVIDRTGAVSEAQDGGSAFPEPTVVKCVVDRFRALRFAPPRGGIVTVVYPIIFNPG